MIMKRKVMIIAMMLISMATMSQQFDGININGSLQSVVNAFKAKDYKFENYFSEGRGAKLVGKVGYRSVSVYIGATPLTKQVTRVNIYTKEKTDWSSLETEYWELYEILVKKYGEPNEDGHVFLTPYERGDGYEMTAVRANKTAFFGYWENAADNLSIMLEISESASVRMVYENKKAAKLQTTEQSKLDSNSF